MGVIVSLAMLLGIGASAMATEPGALPAPAPGVRVIDPDDRLTSGEEASLQTIATIIERGTGAQVAFVVTVAQGWRPTGSNARLQAQHLMDRWGVGRAGPNDGVVVLVMLDDSRCHGGAYLYLGTGALDAWFGGDASGVQALYDREVDPRLRACDIGGAMLAAGEGLARAAGVPTSSREAAPAEPLSAGMTLLLTLALVLAVMVAAITIGW